MQNPWALRADCNLVLTLEYCMKSRISEVFICPDNISHGGWTVKTSCFHVSDIMLFSWVLSPTWYIIRFFCFQFPGLHFLVLALILFFAQNINDCQAISATGHTTGVFLPPQPTVGRFNCFAPNSQWVFLQMHMHPHSLAPTTPALPCLNMCWLKACSWVCSVDRCGLHPGLQEAVSWVPGRHHTGTQQMTLATSWDLNWGHGQRPQDVFPCDTGFLATWWLGVKSPGPGESLVA